MSKIIASGSICSAPRPEPPGRVTAPVLTIDPGAVVDNWRQLAARHAGDTAAVVKADAYGLGAALVAPALASAGCRHFFVATPDEAFSLRTVLADPWIAVLNGCPAGMERDFIAHRLTPVLNSLGDVARWRTCVQDRAMSHPAVLHIDTGMSRLGLDRTEMARLDTTPDLLTGVTIIYILSHLVSAEQPDCDETRHQAARFARLRARFPGVKTSFANSSGMFLGPAFESDLARPGYALYGGNPIPGRANPMRPVVGLGAPILQIRQIEPGDTVGYNATWRAARPSLIATIGVGYADGMPRTLANRLLAYHNEKPVPLVGRVSMDLMSFDITDCPALAPGDLLDLIGPHHGIDDVAREAGTLGYEILTSLGRRYRRVAKSV